MVATDGRDLAFILSTPRAGSTLLGAMLGSHSRVHCPPEPWFLLPLVSARDERFLVAAPYDHQHARTGTRELLDDELFDASVTSFAVTAYNALLARANKDVFVDKTPRYYHILPWLDRLFPRAAKIWLRRNPLDVIASCKTTWGLSIPELLGDPLSPYSFDVTVSLELLANHFARRDPRTCRAKYEDLVRHPASTMEDVCTLLGVPFEPSMLEYGENEALVGAYGGAAMGDKKVLAAKSAHGGSVGRWRDALTPREVRTVVLTLGASLFERLGYEDALVEAVELAELREDDVSPDGEMPKLREAYAHYAEAAEDRLERSGLLSRSDVQYTLVARQAEEKERAISELGAAGEERLELIRRLEGDLRAQAEGSRADIEAIDARKTKAEGVAEASLRVIQEQERALETQRSAASDRLELARRLESELKAARGRHESELKSAGARHESELQSVQAELQSARAELQSARALEAIVTQLQGRMAELDAVYRDAHASAEAAAADRLQVIEQQRWALEERDRALGDRDRKIAERDQVIEAYRRPRWRERLDWFMAPRLGVLHQYTPQPLVVPDAYRKPPPLKSPPVISIVTPSYRQGEFIERTIKSIVDQGYPYLEYIIQDGGSRDETLDVLARYEEFLAYAASVKDNGFGNAINRGFRRSTGEIMAWLNSDDLLLPGTLHYVASYFERHPNVDVVYGHRVVIDSLDADIGRWVLPPHDDEILSWADYVPQETMFWRREIWEKAGGQIDESLRFAIDWDLLLRFRAAGATFARVPRFLGGFRVHAQQKTSSQMVNVGDVEMSMLRERCHGRRVNPAEINAAIRPYLRRHVLYHKLYRLGVLRY